MGVLIFLAGFFSYGSQANFWPLSPELLGAKYVGTGIGIMNMCAYVFDAIGEPLVGKLLDIFKNESVIFLAVAATALASSLTILLVHVPKRRRE